MVLRPLGKSFLFEFLNNTRHGIFTQQNKGLIVLPNAAPDIDRQGDFARFAKVTAVGEGVSAFVVGDVVLISALKWTKGMDVQEDLRLWKSDEDQVIAVHTGEDLDSIAYDFYASTRVV